MTGRLLLLALAAGLCLAADAAAATRWTAVRSESMTVIGDQSASTLRDVAQQLEQFRTVLGLLSSGGQPAPTAPTMVYVFGSRKAFEPFIPLRNGKPISVGGYFQRSVDVNTIAFSTEGFAEDAPVIFHEYSHLLVGTAVRSIPIWLNEGLAEYFSTFRLSAGGKGANIGLAVARHVALLRERFIPLAQLLAVDQTSELYNEGERRSIFYAESWALTHYLMTELPSGQTLINQYAGAIAGGAKPEQAFDATFGMTPAVFEPRLREYVRHMSFKAWIYTFNERLQAEASLPARVLSPGEAEAWLGDLQLRIHRRDEATKRIEGAAAAEPDSAPTQLALGRLRLLQERTEDAWPPLERAARLAPDSFEIQYGVGVATLQSLDGTGGGPAPTWSDARTTRSPRRRCSRPIRRTPSPGWPMRGCGSASGTRRPRAISRAIGLAPGRIEFRLRQADIMILRGAPNVARPMLQELIARSADSVTIDAARRRLEALDAATLPRTVAPDPTGPGAAAAAGPRRRAGASR